MAEGEGDPRCADAAPRAQAMLNKWTGMLAEAGLRGKHVSFEPAGASQVRVTVRGCAAWALTVR